MQQALNDAAPQPLKDINPEGVEQNFVAPAPAVRTEQVDTNTERIDYAVPSDRYNAVGKRLGLRRGREIGLRTFDYFYSREIED